MAYNTSAGISRMAQTLSNRMKEESETPLFVDFGGIGNDYSLTTNTFPVPIPKGSYEVCRHISGISASAIGGAHEGHTAGNGEHGHAIALPHISPGDRVLVAWVQSVPVIIDVIVNGGSI